MLDKWTIEEEIENLKQHKMCFSTCEKLAALITIKEYLEKEDMMYGFNQGGYVNDVSGNRNYGGERSSERGGQNPQGHMPDYRYNNRYEQNYNQGNGSNPGRDEFRQYAENLDRESLIQIFDEHMQKMKTVNPNMYNELLNRVRRMAR